MLFGLRQNMTKKPPKAGLSKSRILAWRQCPKRLWLQIHRPDLADVSDATFARFSMGAGVGEVARNPNPGGVLIGHGEAPSQALTETAALLEKPGDRTVYEAAFAHDGVLVRTDLLFRKRGKFDVIEVKAATSVKDYYYDDAAVQACVMESAGCPARQFSIAHVNSSFVYPGGGNYDGLLETVDVTADMEPIQEKVGGWVDEARSVLAGKEPEIRMGGQCDDPYPC